MDVTTASNHACQDIRGRSTFFKFKQYNEYKMGRKANPHKITRPKAQNNFSIRMTKEFLKQERLKARTKRKKIVHT